MKTNRKAAPQPSAALQTHEGAPAKNINVMQQLRRSVLSCMLWEDTFYEGGEDIAQRITKLTADAAKVGKAGEVAELAIKARSDYKLRHAPLHLSVALSRAGKLRASTLVGVIQRPDELTELLSLYWKDGRVPLSRQMKLGLGWAFRKFNAYSLAKYNQDGPIKLRDVLFMTHAKPADKAQAKLWKQLVDGTLATPDTWETNLSAGADKAETFRRLMAEKTLGALAFLRNLRNMQQAGITKAEVKAYSETVDITRVLPFRFIAAARAVPTWEDILEPMMLRALDTQEKLPGRTKLLVDVSGSMDSGRVSAKSDLKAIDAAVALAILLASICEEVEISTFSDKTVKVPTRKGFALADAIIGSQRHNGTLLGQAVKDVKGDYDRLIVFTDEQSADSVPGPDRGSRGYMVNVASYKNGVGYGPWVHIDGFSEAIVDYIREYEKD